MQHSIIELEDGTLTLTIAEVARHQLTVTSCRRVALGNLHGDGPGAALRALQAEFQGAMARVHVLLGERRCQHFTLQLPRLASAQLRTLVVRESLRLAGLPEGTAMLARARVVKRSPHGRFVLGVTAVASDVWEPLARVFQGLGIEVLSLATVEDGLGQAIDFSLPPRTAVVEFSSGRARFVCCEHGAPTQVRRFLVSGFESGDAIDPAVLGAQLAMEVPRTLDYLKEQGQARPEALLLSRRTGLCEDDLEVFTEQGIRCVLARADWQLADGADQPGLASIGRLRALQRGVELTSLSAGVTVHLPMSRTRPLLLAAGLATGLFGIGLGTAQLGVVDGMRLELRQLRLESARLDRTAAASTVASGATSTAQLAQRVLAMRRPCSLLLAQICNATAPACELQRIDFDGVTGVTVSGRVVETSRTRALAALRAFADGLGRIGCVANRGREEVGELDGDAARLRFSLALRWRQS